MTPPSTVSNARPRLWSNTQSVIAMRLKPPLDPVPNLMRPVGPAPSGGEARALVAAVVGGVRLLDNVRVTIGEAS